MASSASYADLEKIFLSALNELLWLDSDWVQPGIGNSVHIRPFIFGSEH